MKNFAVLPLAAALCLGIACATPTSAATAPVRNPTAGTEALAPAQLRPSSQRLTNDVAPVLEIDESHTTFDYLRVLIGWVPGQEYYDVEYASSADFEQDFWSVRRNSPSEQPADPETYFAGIYDLKAGTTYYIRVRAVDLEGNAGAWRVITGTTKSSTPGPITTSTSRSANGSVTIKWEHDPQANASYRLHVARSAFAAGSKGAKHITVNLPRTRSSYTLSSTELTKLAAAQGSGREIYYRVQVINKGNMETFTRYSPTAKAVMPGQKPLGSASKAAKIRFGSYNVSKSGESGQKISWSSRRNTVARIIAQAQLDIVAVQEANAGNTPASGQLGSLLTAVKTQEKKVNAKSAQASWKLVRSTRFVAPGKTGGHDGTRIMYDSKKVTLLSKCTDTTGTGKSKKNYSTSCTVKLPRIGAASTQRYAAIAQFQDKTTKTKFWVINANLDTKSGSSYDKHRETQIKAVLAHAEKVRKASGQAVFILGDINSTNSGAQDKPVINRLVAAGYSDAISAKQTENTAYSTVNNWKKQSAVSAGFATRSTAVWARASRHLSFVYYGNVKNGYKASNHNLVKVTATFK